MNYPAAEERGIKNSIAHAIFRLRAADPDNPKNMAVGTHAVGGASCDSVTFAFLSQLTNPVIIFELVMVLLVSEGGKNPSTAGYFAAIVLL